MREQLWLAAERNEGVLSRDEALTLAAVHVLDDMVSDGLLVRAFPGTYVTSDRSGHRDVLARAALRYRAAAARRRGAPWRQAALSHLDALTAWRLPCPPLPVTGTEAVPIHVTEGPGPAVQVKGIEVHRRRDYADTPVWRLPPHGDFAVSPAQAIVESWPLLPSMDQRSPLIVGIRDRRVHVEQILDALAARPNCSGAGEMRDMAGLIAGGLHSHLELWGHAHVFIDPRLIGAKAQFPIRLRSGRKVYLDRYYEDLLLNVELDGAAYHGLPGQRERDLKRDAALAALGILVVRFSHQRLHRETAAVVEELAEIIAVRRRQLSVA
jgi:very-short-patch-repair endonuclease